MVKVNQSKCIGCQLCVSTCPEVYKMKEDGKAYVKPDADANKNTEKILTRMEKQQEKHNQLIEKLINVMVKNKIQ